MVKLSTIFSDNLEILWESAERSTKTHGISVVFEDLDGMRITAMPDRPERQEEFIQRYIICDICKEIYRKRNITEARLCNISDRDASWKALAMKLQIPFLFRCHAGASNFLIPIIIGGSVVGNVFGGQFFIERGRGSEADENWVRDMKKVIESRWKIEGWVVDDEMKDDYETGLDEFLLGPESGGYTIARYIDWLNSKYINEKIVEEKTVPISLLPEYRKTIYGIDRWELIEDLIRECFEHTGVILESLKILKDEGNIACPNPTRKEVAKFLDLLKQRSVDATIDTKIDDANRRQEFERKYRSGIEKYEKVQDRRAKPLEVILDIIGKLYSEAIALSRLGNERYYLKLYEGVSSRIPEFVENRCKQELDWIRENMRKLIIGIDIKKSPKMSEYQESILEMNRKFHRVLTEFQDYQEKYTDRVQQRLGELVGVRYGSSESNLLYQFFTSYRNSICILGDIDEEIDRCERVYLISILRLQQLRRRISELEGELERQESAADDLAKERFEIERMKYIEQDERERKLDQTEKRLSEIDLRKQGIQEDLANLDEIIGQLDSQKENFLRGIYDCKKASDDLKKRLEQTHADLNTKLKSLLETDETRPKYDPFGIAFRIVSEEPELLGIQELRMDCRLLSDTSAMMKKELATLEEIEKTSNYDSEKSKDGESIGIIGIKDWRTNGLVWINDLAARLMSLYHKKGFHVRYDTFYFNAGGLAPVHTDIEAEQEKWMIVRDETGPVSKETEERIERELKITRKYLGFILDVNENEIVLTDSTTEGIFLVLNAINFQNGDEIVTTDSEHDVVRYLLRRTKEKHEAHNIHVEIIPCKEEEITSKVTRRTRLVVFSDILFTTGDRLRSEKIISESRQKYAEETARKDDSHKSASVLFLIDGAQSVGQTDINLTDLDCDFFAMDGHKWLLASEGSGALFVKERYLNGNDEGVKFTFIKNYMVTDWVDGYHPKDEEGRHYELATINLSSKIGLKSAIQIIARDGLVALSDGILNHAKSTHSRNEIAWLILDDAFDKKGNLKAIDVSIGMPSGTDTQFLEDSPLNGFMTIQHRDNKLFFRCEGAEETRKLLCACLEKGTSMTRESIRELKDYFWQCFEQLQRSLRANSQCKINVERVTKKDNEGGVVGFQLIERSTNAILDWAPKQPIREYAIHGKLGRILEEKYKIIFRVIPPPYPPAIRICLHKYNTTSEIDLLFHALDSVIPELV